MYESLKIRGINPEHLTNQRNLGKKLRNFQDFPAKGILV